MEVLHHSSLKLRENEAALAIGVNLVWDCQFPNPSHVHHSLSLHEFKQVPNWYGFVNGDLIKPIYSLTQI